MVSESHVLGFDRYPAIVEEMIDIIEWTEPLNRLRMGVVLTFATTVPYHGGPHRFFVDILDSGHDIYLQYPGQNNKGFDYELRVVGWDDSAMPRPSHDEIYSDFAHKRENSNRVTFEALCQAAFDIHGGSSADEVLQKYGDRFDFSVGRTPEALLRPLPWLFIEQDIRYWHGEGRDMTIGTIQSLYEGGSIE